MGNVLTAASDVECGHKRHVTVTGASKLTVGGSGVLVSAGVVGASVPPLSCSTKPSSSTKPCSSVASILPSSLATKLKVNGQPVVLDTLHGATDGNPTGALQ